MGVIRALIGRMEALERARAVPLDPGAGPSGGGGVPPPKVPRRTGGATRTQLLKSISSRLEALEKAGAPAGPDAPSEPAAPSLPSPDPPGQPAPARPPDPVPALPGPVLLQPVAPVEQPPLDPSLPVALGRQIQGVSSRGCDAPGPHAGSPVAAWQLEAQQAIAASLVPSTRVSYAAKIAAFAQFRMAEGLAESWPAPGGHLQQFLVLLHRAGRSGSTLGGYLAALSFEAQVRGVGDTSSNPRIRCMLEGWARISPAPSDSRRPITLDMLVSMVGRLDGCCSIPWEVSLFRAALLVAFFGAFRPSELLPRSSRSPRDCCLQLSDLTFAAGTAVLCLRRSKTDQRGKGQLVTLAGATGSALCPVAALKHYIGLCPRPGGCLFLHESGCPLTQYQFLTVIRKVLGGAGIPTAGLTLHSFRIGAASTASGMGMTEDAVRRIGRWRCWWSGCSGPDPGVWPFAGLLGLSAGQHLVVGHTARFRPEGLYILVGHAWHAVGPVAPRG
ncbi:uncharacterized protein LOC128327499 [Hemicordylus capensis]|uniref:uncharacterized protein LOC128327499 n=1 Tax=Hemicordylus capensis TaxID=884348 RepID=UPI00230389F5|nr:uncharacterized protein LOC128327499 [Hemicordylus capensis]